MDGDVACTVVGYGGRRPRGWTMCRGDWAGGVTQAGDVGLTSQGRAVSGFGGRGYATPQSLTRGGSTATKPPNSRTLKPVRVGDGDARQPLICGAGDPTVGGDREVSAG